MHETELLALAARQHGLAHRKQLTELGATKRTIRHLVETGRWQWRTGHVLRLTGAPVTDDQEAMAAVLDLGAADAALSHRSAAASWGLPGFARRPYHVVGNRTRGRNHRTLARVHQPRLLLEDHILSLRGVPTVSPTLTLFQLAGMLRWPQQVERAVDNALAARLTSPPLLEATLARLARKGRPGIRLMRALIEARLADPVPFGSGLEARFREVARRAGLTGFTRQVDVGDDYDWLGRVDFVDRSRKIIVEVQSERFHAALLDQERDRRRIAALRAAGWIVIEIREHDLWYDPDAVVAALHAARRAA